MYAFTAEIDDWRERRRTATSSASRSFAEFHTFKAPRNLVGRNAEFARLHTHVDRALSGDRQVVFVTGEIGIGKTALSRSFVTGLEADAWVLQGQCVEQYGAGEAYLPVIEALAKLIRGPEGRRAGNILAQYAPSWLMHVPDHPNRQSPQSDVANGGGPDRMIREIVDALEILAQDKLVVLLLEDLHWSDRSTIELIERIARRDEAARILVMGTYRPEELIASQHPLLRIQHELRVHGLCDQIHVPRLSQGEVAEYLEQRSPGHHLTCGSGELHHWTGGNPLFLTVLIDHLIDTGCVTLECAPPELTRPIRTAAPSIPPALRDIIGDRIDRLNTIEQQVLKTASVAGSIFSAAAVATTAGIELNQVEQLLQSLADRQQFLERRDLPGVVGNGRTAGYCFLHSLYQQILYERLSPSSRAALHLAMGVFLEQVHTQDYEEVAAELASHFERAHDFARAARYYDAASATALARGAPHEAHDCAVKALAHLSRIPESAERDRQELSLRLKICAAVSNILTMGDPEVEKAYSEALRFCDRVGDDAQVVPALLGLVRFHVVRGNVEACRSLSERAVTVARVTGDRLLLVEALNHRVTSFFNASQFAEAHVCGNEALLECDRLPADADWASTMGFSPIVSVMLLQSYTSWFLGYPDQALRLARDTVATAETLAHPQTLAFAKAWAAVTFEWCGDHERSHHYAETSLVMATELELPMGQFFAQGVLGWVLGRRGSTQGIDNLRRSLEFQSSTGILLWASMMKAWLAESLLCVGETESAMVTITEGLEIAKQTGVHYYDAELYGLRADALGAGLKLLGETDRAEASHERDSAVRRAYSIARAQRAKSLELRAAARLVRASTNTKAVNAALDILAQTHAWFSEGYTTQDLLAARVLLDGHAPSR